MEVYGGLRQFPAHEPRNYEPRLGHNSLSGLNLRINLISTWVEPGFNLEFNQKCDWFNPVNLHKPRFKGGSFGEPQVQAS